MAVLVVLLISLFFTGLFSPGFTTVAVLTLVALLLCGASARGPRDPDPERPTRPEWMDRRGTTTPLSRKEVVTAFVMLPLVIIVPVALWFVPLYGLSWFGRLCAWLFS